MKNCLFVALMFLLALPSSWAQPTGGNNQPTEKLETIADNNLQKYDTWNALDFYKQVYERKSEDPKAAYDVAYTYYLLRDYASAEEWFKKTVDKDKENSFTLARWFYAYNMKLNGKYDECIPQFEQFINEYDGDQANLKKLAEIEIEGAKWAQGQNEPFEELKIENVGKLINSPLMENYAYPVGRNKIIFSSLRSDTIIMVEEAEEDSKYAKIYMIEREEGEDGELSEWTEESVLFNPSVVNREEYHSVNPTFNKDMTQFYFTRARLTGNMLENSKIYTCSYDGETLGEPMLLDFNDNTYSCKNPAVGKIGDKEYLFFVSDMPGGQGATDIWWAEIAEDGTTRQPLSLGNVVNTVGVEVYPFFDERDNNLYFGSTGHPGMGGVDLFYSHFDEETGEWGEVKNMGPGFNTSVDEFAFNITRTDKDDCYGYFISNREGTTTVRGKTSTDDIYSILMPDRCDVDVDVCVKNKESGEEIKGATVQLIDKSTGEVVEEQTNTESCDFSFSLEQGKQYDIVAKKDGWESGATTPVDTRKEALVERFGTTDNPMTWSEETTLKEVGLIVETFNSKTQEPLSGVTVIVYNSKTNEKVKERTESEGNRFEFKIPRSTGYRIQARLEGYIGESKDISMMEMKNAQKLYLTPPPIFVNVLFDFDKSNIRTGASDTLDKVATILTDYPDMIVEVRGHTDAKGTNAYNNRLSQRRAKSAMQYLIDKGVDKDRLITKGFGENEPIAPNETEAGDDNPQGRQLNRRVEFKIIEGAGAVTEPADDATSAVEVEKKSN